MATPAAQHALRSRTLAWIAIPYLVLIELSELLSTQAGDIAAFWPPAGLALALVVLWGRRAYVVVATVSIVSNFIDPFRVAGAFVSPTVQLAGVALVDAALACCLAFLASLPLRGRRPEALFTRVRPAAEFVALSACVAPAMTAALGAAYFCASGTTAWARFGETWLTWTTGDIVGILVVTPLVVSWAHAGRSILRWPWLAELAAVLVAIFLIGIPVLNDYPLEYLTLLPLTWVSFRLGLPGASGAVLLIAIVATQVDTSDSGYFGRFGPVEGGLLVQTFVASVAILPLMLVAALAERRDAFEHSARLKQDLQLARDIQQGLLPSAPPTIQGFEIAGSNVPADETGGDYYDWFAVADGRMAVLLGDVTGHGVGPALVASTCRAYARSATIAAHEPGSLLTELNALLSTDLPMDRFITLVAADLRPGAGEIRLKSAGHGPLFLYREATREVEVRNADEIPLGVFPDRDYGGARTIELSAGDMLVLITDGYTEWANAGGELFGAEGVTRTLKAARQASAAEVIRMLDADVRRHASGTPQNDDLTAVVIRRL